MKRLFTLLTALMLATALCAPVLADDAAVTDPTPEPTPTPTASIDTSNSDGVYVSAYTVTNAAGGEFPFGYPYSFVMNQIHQYVLIFRKEL